MQNFPTTTIKTEVDSLSLDPSCLGAIFLINTILGDKKLSYIFLGQYIYACSTFQKTELTLIIVRPQPHRWACKLGCYYLEVEDKRQCLHLCCLDPVNDVANLSPVERGRKFTILAITNQAWVWGMVEIQPLEHLNGCSPCQHLTRDLREAQMRAVQLNSEITLSRKKEQSVHSSKVDMHLSQQQVCIIHIFVNAPAYVMCLWSKWYMVILYFV